MDHDSGNFSQGVRSNKQRIPIKATCYFQSYLVEHIENKGWYASSLLQIWHENNLMPLLKETIAWTVDIARSLAMLQKNTQCTRSAHIEFWMQLNSLFNKCRRTVILIFTKLCHRKKSSRTWEHLSDGPLDFWLGVRGGAGGLGNKPQKNLSQP